MHYYYVSDVCRVIDDDPSRLHNAHRWYVVVEATKKEKDIYIIIIFRVRVSNFKNIIHNQQIFKNLKTNKYWEIVKNRKEKVNSSTRVIDKLLMNILWSAVREGSPAYNIIYFNFNLFFFGLFLTYLF